MNARSEFSFFLTKAQIVGNANLRLPQEEGYVAIRKHFTGSGEQAYVQLPVGCGKTGLMGITPFELSQGRVLIVAPNLTIRDTIYRELNISDPDCFYIKRSVLTPPPRGPFISELKTGANIHDCDAAHIVIANIQQFAGRSNRWYEKLDRDYFDMILIDEGHHAPAESWQRLVAYFDEAKVVSFTGTPFRSDGQSMQGKRVYTFGYTRAMVSGYISPIEAVYITPEELTFTVRGKTQTLTLDQIREMSEKDWFSKGVALSEVCNQAIVDASIRQLHEVRKFGSNRQIIAATCSIRHATMVAALYRERGLTAEIITSDQDEKERKQVEAALRQGTLDAVVQVQILGEGYDLGTLSVGALFRPYRHLAPYVQFVGRILRLADPLVPHSPTNKVYLVSHVGLNDERWWNEFTQFDERDQRFFREITTGTARVVEDGKGPRVTLRPFMRVLNETIQEYAIKGYLKEIDEALLEQFKRAMREHGFDLAEFGLSDDALRTRLTMAAARQVPATELPVQPQRRREAMRARLAQDARSAADAVINRLKLNHAGQRLAPLFPGSDGSDVVVVTRLVNGWLNKQMSLETGQREQASAEQLELGLEKAPDAVDALATLIGEKLKEAHKGAKT
ncbi:MAG TPA: DEAD/DEAH box helicase family protein [Nitrospiraceae bacterium]|nr:DEAD/DEAH box helicase family protein [Nitrospiraceae bacterium]